MEIIKTKSFELAAFTRGNTDAKRVAVLLPGRLDTKDYVSFKSHADYLAGRGFFVVAFDAPGTWESPGSINLFTTTNYLKATNEIIEYFGNRPTLLLGHSRGASVAILASVNPAVIGIIPVMANYGAPTEPVEKDIERGYKISYRDLPPGDSKTKEQKKFELPIAYWTDGKQYNPSEVIKQCAKPKLVVYSTDDDFTPVDVVKKLYEEIPEPKMILEVHCTHDYRYSTDAIQKVNVEIGRFLEKYIP